MDGYNTIDSVVSYHRDGRGREWGQCGGERMKRKVSDCCLPVCVCQTCVCLCVYV